MDIFIDGKKAVIKKGSSFDYVSENRAFSDSDDYTLSITLPLTGCIENIKIFGHINRMDFGSRQFVREATIYDANFVKHGVITVVDANEYEVKIQFLEGRSVQNFMTTFDDVYINELNLGRFPVSLPSVVSYGNIDSGHQYVALPWWNEDQETMNNETVADGDTYKWSEDTKEVGKLSYMPYLIFIAKKICENRGYTYDFSQWEDSDDRHLLVCNALPAAWDIPDIARALPRWTVTEFFEELEKILVCEINIDHKSRHIDLTFCKNVVNTENEILLHDVLDEVSCEVSYNDEICKFKGSANIKYADRGDVDWKEDQCQWLVSLFKQEGRMYREFQTEQEFFQWDIDEFGIIGITGKNDERPRQRGYLVHVIESDRYLVYKVVYANYEQSPNMYYYKWVEINRFGDFIQAPDSDNAIELSCVPAHLGELDEALANCIFLSPSGFSEKDEEDEDGVTQPIAYGTLLKGEPSDKAEYYDKIFLAYWYGESANDRWQSNYGKLLPKCPYADGRFSLSRRYKNYLQGLKVSPMEKVKVSWLSSKIPDVRAIYNIKGQRYLCEKITATFTENGMSQLLKGEFYPILDKG